MIKVPIVITIFLTQGAINQDTINSIGKAKKYKLPKIFNYDTNYFNLLLAFF